MKQTIRNLLDFIADSTSPFHTVQSSEELLKDAGFTALSWSDDWHLSRGGRYYVSVYGSTLLAFAVGGQDGPLRMAAAHTDFPCLRLKPQAGMLKEGYGLLNVERYGGLILRSWLDRPLSLAGKVVLRGLDAFHPETRLVDIGRPLLTIPSLAIHMDREVNEKGALNPQKDMLPLAAAFGRQKGLTAGYFLSWLALELGVPEDDILSYELSTYPAEQGTVLGLAGEMISSPRLDNLTSVFACLKGLCAAEQFAGIRLVALFDNEEVGSRTKQGAGSLVLPALLSRIYRGLSLDEERMQRDLGEAFLLSVDVAHAMHPNYIEKSDPVVRPVLGGGLAIKQAASQSYAGDAEAVAIIKELCASHDIPCQFFVNRSDSRGGSTLGSIASALVPVRTMDVGVPILAMHSARETMGAEDQEALMALLRAFLA